MPASQGTAPSIGWLRVQKRPVIAANAAGALLFLAAAWVGVPERIAPVSPTWLLGPGLLYYFAIVLSFVAPLWLVQAIVYAQMWQQGQPRFVNPAAWRELDPQYRCRFLLSLRGAIFVLALLYLDSRRRPHARSWTRPAWLFLALSAASLFGFCMWTSSLPITPSPLLISPLIFCFSALIFGLSHLVQGE